MTTIHYLELYVSDLAHAKRFYEPLLLALDFSGQSGKTHVKDGLLFCLQEARIKGPARRGTPGLHHLTFEVGSRSEVDRIYREVIKKLRGVTIQDPAVSWLRRALP